MPFVTKRRHAAKGESRVWGAVLTRVLKRPLVSTRDRRRPARRPLHPRARACSSRTRASTATRAASRSSRPTTGSRPPSPAAPSRPRSSIKAEDVTAAPVQAAIAAAARPRAGHRPALRALARRDQPRQDRRRRRALGQGQRHRRRLRALARDAALRGRPRHRRQAGRRRGRRDRRDRRLEGLHRRHDLARADRVRVRAQPRVHPAAGHVPLDRGADQGDRPQPAVGRRRLRHPRARLPGRPRREAARLPVGRRHRPRGSRCSCS